jgi:DNA-binding PadR family transcriptional regulator
MKPSFNRIQRRIVKSFRDIAILSVLKENDDLSGYQIMGCIFEKLGILLSQGTIYSTLYALEREGVIIGTSHSKSRTYKLTPKGHSKLEEANEIVTAFNLFAKEVFGEAMSGFPARP